MTQAIQTLINVWRIDFYAGWSIMDIATITALLYVVSLIINYFFFKADAK